MGVLRKLKVGLARWSPRGLGYPRWRAVRPALSDPFRARGPSWAADPSILASPGWVRQAPISTPKA